MRILFVGDIYGKPGRRAASELVPKLIEEREIDFTIMNGENAAGGFGVTPQICDDLFASGIDVLTTGNHVWDKREIVDYIEHQPRLLRPPAGWLRPPGGRCLAPAAGRSSRTCPAGRVPHRPAPAPAPPP